MSRQFQEIKKNHPDAILFFRLGDFYEMFGDDALLASRILNITLTSRNKGEKSWPMCGVPYHSAETYIAKLTRAGKKVAICEQISDPKQTGIVERAVVRTVTPGTTFSENVLEGKKSNFLIALKKEKGFYGLAKAEISTADFQATEIEGEDALAEELARLNPAECVLDEKDAADPQLRKIIARSEHIHVSVFATEKNPAQILTDHFKTKNLAGFSLEQKPLAVEAAGNLLAYMKETQQSDLNYIKTIRKADNAERMIMDAVTISNLEIFETATEKKHKGSLLWLLDETATAMGGRMLREWMLNPLLQPQAIAARLEAVAGFFHKTIVAAETEVLLSRCYDLERILARLGCLGGNARDLVALQKSLSLIPSVKTVLQELPPTPLLQQALSGLDDCGEIVDLISSAINEEAPLSVREGGLIKAGFCSDLDILREFSRRGKNFISALEAEEIKKTGINSLKIRYNRVFGYYIEVRKIHLTKIPPHYTRKQTLVNAERFITAELKEYEEKVLSAQEKIGQREYDLFQEIKNKVLQAAAAIQKNARLLAMIDVLSALAKAARKRQYCRPELASDGEIEIEGGRHPVVEVLLEESVFVPNSVHLGAGQKIKLITGPNMGGKSTFLRQMALIVFLTQIGSFVPARRAKITPVDRIFTRVGASDNLIKGQSTFMVEMRETANILDNATANSLVILDEVGRGTSTFDGVSIAWAILDHLHDHNRSKTLFATHYHELIPVAEALPEAENLCVAIAENSEGVTFLYRVVKGAIDRSYGLEVAKIAGLPAKVIDRARLLLPLLESRSAGYESVMTKREKRKLTMPTVHKTQLNINF